MLDVGSLRQSLDGVAADFLVDDHSGNEKSADTDANSKLRTNANSGEEIEGTHPDLLARLLDE
jgi:hypothetical protein